MSQVKNVHRGQGPIVGVIVCYYPDLSRLLENVAAIRPQVDQLIIHCNECSSSNGLTKIAKDFECILQRSSENRGLAKALNRSCKVAQEEFEAKFAILLDQDSVADVDMVKRLLQFSDENTGIVSPLIVDRNWIQPFTYRKQVHEVPRAITSGALISLKAWKSVGGFDNRLFVDWVDYEFCYALRTKGYLVRRNENAEILHEMGRKEYVGSIPGLSKKRMLYRTNHSKDRLEDKGRSWAIFVHEYWRGRLFPKEFAYIVTIAIRDLMLERDRLGTVQAFIRGIRSGIAIATGRKGREGSDV